MAPRRKRKHCAPLNDLGSVVQKKRRRVSPYLVEGNDLILGSQQKREKCLLSDDSVNKPKKGKVVPCSNLDVYENDLISGSKNKREKCTTLYDSVNKPKKRRVKPKRKKLFPAGHGQKQKRRVYDTNATHLKSQSPSSSSVDQIPAALDQTVIQYQIHDMIKNLAKSKKNVTSTSHSNIHINASSKSLAEQSLIAKETEYEEPMYTKQNEMNEDLVEKKIMEVIQQYIIHILHSGTTNFDADIVKTIIHRIVDEYIDVNMSGDDSYEENDAENVDNYMDEAPGCSSWFYPKYFATL